MGTNFIFCSDESVDESCEMNGNEKHEEYAVTEFVVAQIPCGIAMIPNMDLFSHSS
jgi:hypothetical protein